MKKITFEPTICLACKSCELQCAVEHSQSKTLFGAINEYPLPQARVRVVAANGMAVREFFVRSVHGIVQRLFY